MAPRWYLTLALLSPTVVTVGLGQCHFPAPAGGRLLTYTFNPEVTPTNAVLHITLEFQGGTEGVEEIEVPSQWAGETLRGIVGIRALSTDTVIVGLGSPGVKTIRYPRNHPVVLTYDMVKDWTGPFRHPMQFHGVVMPDYLEINGDNALVHPKLEGLTPVTVNFDWQKIPDTWALATSFGTSSGPDDRCQSYSGMWRDVQYALFTAGQFRIHHFQIGAKPAVLAIRGQWTFTDEQVMSDVDKAVGAVRNFWHDDNFPYFLITLKPYDNDRGNSDGSQFTNAFWLYMSRLDPFTTQLATLAHEAFHAWNPRRMGVVPDSEEARIGWFREGFTQYYGYLLVRRAGLLPLANYLEGVNRDLQKLPGSDDPYLRGRFIALWLDWRIRKDSNHKSSLDNVMLDMVSGADKPLTEARILETAGRYLAPDARVQLDHAVRQGGDVPAPDDALGPCAHVAMEEFPTFDLGFDFAASMEAHKVTGVRQDGPAFKAGLRGGEQLFGWSVHNNQPDMAAKFTIQTDDGGKTKIEYYPRGKTVTLPQYHLDQQAYTLNPAACQTASGQR